MLRKWIAALISPVGRDCPNCTKGKLSVQHACHNCSGDTERHFDEEESENAALRDWHTRISEALSDNGRNCGEGPVETINRMGGELADARAEIGRLRSRGSS